MWAAAVTMFEICSRGERPYKDLHNKEIHRAVKVTPDPTWFLTRFTYDNQAESYVISTLGRPTTIVGIVWLLRLEFKSWTSELEANFSDYPGFSPVYDELHELMSKCWDKDPDRRMSVSDFS